MGSVGDRTRAHDLPLAHVASRAADAFGLERRVELLVGLEDRSQPLAIAKAEDAALLLDIKRDVAVLADLLPAVEGPVRLEVGVAPRTAVHARSPFGVLVGVAGAACRGGRGRRRCAGGRSIDRARERVRDDEDFQRTHEAPGEERHEKDACSQEDDLRRALAMEHGDRVSAPGCRSQEEAVLPESPCALDCRHPSMPSVTSIACAKP